MLNEILDNLTMVCGPQDRAILVEGEGKRSRFWYTRLETFGILGLEAFYFFNKSEIYGKILTLIKSQW